MSLARVTDALRRHPEAVQALRAEEFRFGLPNLTLHPCAGILKQFKYALVWGTSVKHRPQKVGKEHVLQDEDIVQARRPTSSCWFLTWPDFWARGNGVDPACQQSPHMLMSASGMLCDIGMQRALRMLAPAGGGQVFANRMHVWELTVVFLYAASTCSLNVRGSAGGRLGGHRQARKQSRNCVLARADCKEDLGPAALGGRAGGRAGGHARCLAAWVAALRSLPAWAAASCSCLAPGRCTPCAGLSTGEGVACRAGMSSTWFGDCLTVLCKNA